MAKSKMEMQNLNIVTPLEEENSVLMEIVKGRDEFYSFSEMSNEEREFLNSLIIRNKPSKLLELGVSAGASSIVMLNAIKNNDDSMLYSIDYSNQWYRSNDLKTGFFVDEYSELKTKWKLYTGGLASKFIDEIGGEIDFCLIDTSHVNPGEILDFLLILPYLKEDAMVVLHDINLHTFDYFLGSWSITNNILFSAIFGEKFIMENTSGSEEYNSDIYEATKFPNIGAIKINNETRKHIFEIINLLTLKWSYLPKKDEEAEIISHFEKNYNNKFFTDYLQEVFSYQRKHYAPDKLCIRYYMAQIKRLVNKLRIKLK